MQNRKVLFYYSSGSLGGQQMQIYNIASEMLKADLDVYWLVDYPGYFSDQFIKCGGNVVEINHTSALGRVYLPSKIKFFQLLDLFLKSFKMKKVIKNISPDVILVSDSLHTFLTFFPRKQKKVKVFRLIGQDILSYEVFFKYYKILGIDRYVDIYFGFDKVYSDLHAIGINKSKFAKFTSNAVDTSKFYPNSIELKNSLKSQLKIPHNKLVIGWIGRIEKGNQCMNTLLLAEALLKRGFNRFLILFVGGGEFINGVENLEYVEYFKNQAILLGLSSHVFFTGWIDYEEVNNYINVMDIVPMLENDPAGGSILREAMSCGKVALSVDGPSHIQRDFMNDSNSVLVGHIDFISLAANEILSLANDNDRLTRIGNNAREFCVNNMSFKIQAKEIMYYM